MYRPITPFCDPRYVSFTTLYTQCLCVPFGNPHAFLFRSSPRTSALAVGSVKRPSGPRPADTERTPTHTHPFFRAQESHGRPLLSFPVFPFGHLNPSTRRRITRAARVRKPTAENRSNVQKFPFSPSSSCVASPNTPHTYLHPLSLSLWLKRLPHNSLRTLALRLFESPFSESWCTELWNPASDFLEFTLFRFDESTLIR